MNRKLFNVVLLGTSLAISGCNFSVIEPGEVGLKVHQSGSNRGEIEVLEVGRHIYNPLAATIYNYPTYIQTETWEGPNRFQFAAEDGSTLTGSFSVAYVFIEDEITRVYSDFRRSPEEITDEFLQRILRDVLNKVGATTNPFDIYGDGRAKFLQTVEEEFSKEIQNLGLELHSLTLLSLQVPPRLQEAIEAYNEELQKGKQAQAELTRAQAQNEVLLQEARSKAEANQILNESLSPLLMQQQAIEKWNGELPEYTGFGTPFINLEQVRDQTTSE